MGSPAAMALRSAEAARRLVESLPSELRDELLRSVLSAQGYLKASGIMALEDLVRDLERAAGSGSRMRERLGDALHARVRDRELYFFTLFGEPAPERAWSLRCEGHHLSLHVAFVPGAPPSVTPAFFGAFPALVAEGAAAGHGLLLSEAEMAFELMRTLEPAQRERAVLAGGVPADIVTGNAAQIDPGRPVGLPAAEMTAAQQDLLLRLIELYATNFRPEAAAAELRRVRRCGIERVHLAWAGATEWGQPHYYRLHAPRLLIEYDNAQNGANHVHTVYRDPRNDFGIDALRRHHAVGHRRRGLAPAGAAAGGGCRPRSLKA